MDKIYRKSRAWTSDSTHPQAMRANLRGIPEMDGELQIRRRLKLPLVKTPLSGSTWVTMSCAIVKVEGTLRFEARNKIGRKKLYSLGGCRLRDASEYYTDSSGKEWASMPFQILFPSRNRSIYVRARNEQEREAWLDVLRECAIDLTKGRYYQEPNIGKGALEAGKAHAGDTTLSAMAWCLNTPGLLSLAENLSAGNGSKKFSKADEDRIYRDLFGLPESEHVIDVWQCAVRKSLILHGWLWMSENFLCFYSSVFSFKSLIVIPFCDMIGTERATDLVTSGIQVFTETARHYFVHFWSRERAFRKINRYWWFVRDKMMSIEIGQEFPDPLLQKRLTKRYSEFKPQSPDDELDENDIGRDVMEEYKLKGVSSRGQPVCACVPTVDNKRKTLYEAMVENPAEVTQETVITPVVSSIPSDDLNPHLHLIHDEELDISVFNFFILFYSNSSTFYLAFLENSGDSEIAFEDWKPSPHSDDGGHVRQLKFITPVNAPMAPKATRVHESHVIRMTSDRSTLVYETQTKLLDLPFNDAFIPHTRWVLTKTTDNKCRLQATGRFEFLKNVWIKGKIEKDGMKDVKRKMSQWIEVAKGIIHSTSRKGSGITQDPVMRERITTRAQSVIAAANNAPQHNNVARALQFE